MILDGLIWRKKQLINFFAMENKWHSAKIYLSLFYGTSRQIRIWRLFNYSYSLVMLPVSYLTHISGRVRWAFMS